MPVWPPPQERGPVSQMACRSRFSPPPRVIAPPLEPCLPAELGAAGRGHHGLPRPSRNRMAKRQGGVSASRVSWGSARARARRRARDQLSSAGRGGLCGVLAEKGAQLRDPELAHILGRWWNRHRNARLRRRINLANHLQRECAVAERAVNCRRACVRPSRRAFPSQEIGAGSCAPLAAVSLARCPFRRVRVSLRRRAGVHRGGGDHRSLARRQLRSLGGTRPHAHGGTASGRLKRANASGVWKAVMSEMRALVSTASTWIACACPLPAASSW
jgi:hypothetical protein